MNWPLNLALTLYQAKVIKRNINCDASENMENFKLLSVLSDTIFFFNCFLLLLLCKRHRKMGTIEEMGLHDIQRETLQLILSISFTVILCLI